MNPPEGRLVRSRVVDGPGSALHAALDRSVTGYTILAPQATLLLGAEDRGILTFDDGVPVTAYHTGTERGGAPALGDLAVPGPYQCDLYEADPATLSEIHECTALRVPPGLPAQRLAGDTALADRTVAAAPPARADERAPRSAVAAFLEDESKISAIRTQARAEAERRADEWGLADHLADEEAANRDPE